MKSQKDFLPLCAVYAGYIQVAMTKFNMTADEVRDKFGLYTMGQWAELFSKPIVKHYLDDDMCETFATFHIFDADKIKAAIIKYLKENPNGLVEHNKDWGSVKTAKKYCGNEVLNYYECNPKTGVPSLIITKGNKTYYKSIAVG